MTQRYNRSNENLDRGSPPEYETTDFYLASYLKASGYLLMGLGKTGSRTVFRFEDSTERSSDILAYYNNGGSIAPLTLVSAIKEMKALIHSM